MKVYHGSDVKIETIDLSKCRIGTDFGRGFYVTKILKQAEDIADRAASWHGAMPVVTDQKADAPDLFLHNRFAANAFISCKQKRFKDSSNRRFTYRTTDA